MSLNLTCCISMTPLPDLSFKHTLIYSICVPRHTQPVLALQRRKGGRRSCYLSWVGVCWKMCFSYSLSHQPWQTGLLSMQLSAGARDNRLSILSLKFSTFCPSPLSPFFLACICFIAFPIFPHAISFFSLSPPTPVSCTFLSSPLSLVLSCSWPVPPFSLCLISSLLSNGSLWPFPHTASLFPSLSPSIPPYTPFPILYLPL